MVMDLDDARFHNISVKVCIKTRTGSECLYPYFNGTSVSGGLYNSVLASKRRHLGRDRLGSLSPLWWIRLCLLLSGAIEHQRLETRHC